MECQSPSRCGGHPGACREAPDLVTWGWLRRRRCTVPVPKSISPWSPGRPPARWPVGHCRPNFRPGPCRCLRKSPLGHCPPRRRRTPFRVAAWAPATSFRRPGRGRPKTRTGRAASTGGPSEFAGPTTSELVGFLVIFALIVIAVIPFRLSTGYPRGFAFGKSRPP